ncbi:MAG: hypothetical protein ACRC3H_18625 [Lachnospiraceae bacterium]
MSKSEDTKKEKDGNMDMAIANNIYNIITRSDYKEDKIYAKLRQDVLDASFGYSIFTNQWLLTSRKERKNLKPKQSFIHNTFMATLLSLSQYMEKMGWESAWYTDVCDDNLSKKKQGEFAGLLYCVYAMREKMQFLAEYPPKKD